MLIKLMALPGLPAILHLIVGHETEMMMAVEGCALGGEITGLLNKLEPGTPVILKMTRCDSEAEVAEYMARTHGTCVHECGGLGSEPLAKPAAKPKAKTGVCSLCGVAEADTDIPGLRICGQCAGIELGRAREIVKNWEKKGKS